ncbi:MAG: 2-phosphosulfolactate phosphatase [Gemmatimonadetes bacterium]|nr:2-phosphosulfolactate phosphatase [Gemmatimonadota bacterium]
MRIDTYFTVAEVDPPALESAVVVVVDVLRATTTLLEALANGARGVYPTASTEDAVKLAHTLGRDDTLMCGERKGARVEGFDLGNSPREFTREAVEGKRLVMSTTNGTRALTAAQHAHRLIPCAFTNLGAVARVAQGAERLVVICAGREGRYAMDDALCAGHLLRRVLGDAEGELNDASRAARALAGFRKPSRRLFELTDGGRALLEIGLGDDLDVCAQVDRHDILAEMRDQVIVLTGD